MKRSGFFRRRKKDRSTSSNGQSVNTEKFNQEFYGKDMEDVQEYHNPYLTINQLEQAQRDVKDPVE